MPARTPRTPVHISVPPAVLVPPIPHCCPTEPPETVILFASGTGPRLLRPFALPVLSLSLRILFPAFNGLVPLFLPLVPIVDIQDARLRLIHPSGLDERVNDVNFQAAD